MRFLIVSLIAVLAINLAPATEVAEFPRHIQGVYDVTGLARLPNHGMIERESQFQPVESLLRIGSTFVVLHGNRFEASKIIVNDEGVVVFVSPQAPGELIAIGSLKNIPHVFAMAIMDTSTETNSYLRLENRR